MRDEGERTDSDDRVIYDRSRKAGNVIAKRNHQKLSRPSIPVDRLSGVAQLLAASFASKTHAHRAKPKKKSGAASVRSDHEETRSRSVGLSPKFEIDVWVVLN